MRGIWAEPEACRARGRLRADCARSSWTTGREPYPNTALDGGGAASTDPGAVTVSPPPALGSAGVNATRYSSNLPHRDRWTRSGTHCQRCQRVAARPRTALGNPPHQARSIARGAAPTNRFVESATPTDRKPHGRDVRQADCAETPARSGFSAQSTWAPSDDCAISRNDSGESHTQPIRASRLCTTGGADHNATEIAAYLIPRSFDPPPANGQSTLPASPAANAIASRSVTRQP